MILALVIRRHDPGQAGRVNVRDLAGRISAIREAIKLDALEAPQREVEQRKKDVAEASATRDKIRSTNKAAFRP